MQSHPRRLGHGGELEQNMIHWRSEWQTTSVFLPHEQYEKGRVRNGVLLLNKYRVPVS